ncbi:hypothetical protein DQ04_14251000 [Trypanosoma grayi]|uniref:hypothetical protein n=1 Tax=Trypanosoma grayi TaxID=71804 RepID=UPI0004F3F7B6|nr:hypothetical protein DQ04_14251000 [Trypanosoma grayi]KEG06382.1 hypothetical protein DQ04_14251000 [Trypanosoma grayi]
MALHRLDVLPLFLECRLHTRGPVMQERRGLLLQLCKLKTGFLLLLNMIPQLIHLPRVRCPFQFHRALSLRQLGSQRISFRHRTLTRYTNTIRLVIHVRFLLQQTITMEHRITQVRLQLSL